MIRPIPVFQSQEGRSANRCSHTSPSGCGSQQLRYNRWSQSLEVTHGELITGEALLLKWRKELSREEAIQLWIEKRQAGWRVCDPQWSPSAAVQPPAHRAAASMGAKAIRSCF